LLQQGKRREEILFELISSDEWVSKILQENIGLKHIRALKPSQYIPDINLLTSESLLTFKVLDPEDFDWLDQFAQGGLVREIEIEKTLHQNYDSYFDQNAPARKAFYVFSKRGDPIRNQEIIEIIKSNSSKKP
jgi:hypothetical protein